MKMHQLHKMAFEATVGEPTGGQEGFEDNFWGETGAGGLFMAGDNRRILFSHRSEAVNEPGTWGTFGGAMERGESPAQAAQREAREEGADVSSQAIIPLYVFKHPSGFQYFNFLFLIPSEFQPHLTWETQGYEWVEFGDWPSPLHPGTKLLLNDQRSLSIIRKYATV